VSRGACAPANSRDLHGHAAPSCENARWFALDAGRDIHVERKLARILICSALAVALMVPAFADARYIEIWNPPEARGHTSSHAAVPAPAKAVASIPHKPPKRKRVSARVEVRPMSRALAPASMQPPAEAANAHPSYDRIPRQITPEGNVLRVTGRSAHVATER
jgi:hypothetical protein